MWTRVNDLDRMFSAMDLLRSRMNRMFTDFDGSYGESSGWRVVGSFPKTNMYDNGDSFQVIAEVPGVAREDISIKVQGNYLELSGIRKSEVPEGIKLTEQNETLLPSPGVLPLLLKLMQTGLRQF